jgi:hypothetical protein
VERVHVLLRCHCGQEVGRFCVRVSRNVPEPLRCPPSGAGGGGPVSLRCPRGHQCLDDVTELEKATEAQIRRGWGRWQREGVVIVEC